MTDTNDDTTNRRESESDQPLKGVTIVDLTQVLAGPFATRQLADLGADIIKVEQPGVGDPTRKWGPYFMNDVSVYFLGMNRSKRSIALNLRHNRGQEVLHRLIKRADVIVDNYRPSSRPRLGIDYETLRHINPTIISCSLSGFGDVSGYEDKPAFDSIVQAMGGAMSVTGEPGRAPLALGFPMGDLGGGILLIQAVLAGLYARSQTGKGQRAELSMLDAQILLQAHLGQFFLSSGQEPGPIGNSHPFNTPVGAFMCLDGRYIQIHCPTQEAYYALATTLSTELGMAARNLVDDLRFSSPQLRLENRSILMNLLTECFSQRSAEEWVKKLEAQGAPCALVNSLAEALAEPAVKTREMVIEVEHPDGGTMMSAGNPIKFLGTNQHYGPAPGLGEHTEEILQGLGYNPAEIQQLHDEGVI